MPAELVAPDAAVFCLRRIVGPGGHRSVGVVLTFQIYNPGRGFGMTLLVGVFIALPIVVAGRFMLPLLAAQRHGPAIYLDRGG